MFNPNTGTASRSRKTTPAARLIAGNRITRPTIAPQKRLVSSTLAVVVFVIRDVRCSPDHPLGDAIDVLVRREDAERFLDEVRTDDPELARHLRIIERKLKTDSLN
jgi:hypothetical protein